MPSVIALSCPVCGAPLKPGDERCTFCGAYIFIKSDLPKLDRLTLNQSVIQEHIADFRRRVRADQYDEEAHYGLGVAYFNLGLIDHAAEELTLAARLMPENSNIQVQLAVVLRDLLAHGDAGNEKRLQQAIENTLKLDPNNLEALTLQAELLAREGNHGLAERVLGRINQLSPDRLAAVTESVAIARAEGYISENRWSDAEQLISTISETNPSEARRLIVSYLSQHKQEFPLTLVDPAKRAESSKNLGCNTIAGVFGMAVIVLVIAGSGASDSVILLSVCSVILVPITIAIFTVRQARQSELANAIHVNDELFFDPDIELDDLIEAAEGLDAYQHGELRDLDELNAEMAAKGKSAR